MGTSVPAEAVVFCQTLQSAICMASCHLYRLYEIRLMAQSFIWFSFFHSNPFEGGDERGDQVSLLFDQGQTQFQAYLKNEDSASLIVSV